jgi:hypothetical protein
MDDIEEQILYKKNDFTFKKSEESVYNLSFTIKNDCIDLPSIISFEFIKAFLSLNTSIYEKFEFMQMNPEEATISILFKHFFQDLGLLQKYAYLHIYKNITDKKITFTCVSLHADKPSFIPNNIQLLNIDTIKCDCNIITPNDINSQIKIILNNDVVIPKFVEEMIGIWLYKIVKRLKQFIETLKNNIKG